VAAQRPQYEDFDRPPFGDPFLTPARRNHPFGEVIGALERSPFADCELARGPQRGGHLLGDLEVPPAAAAFALHVERAQRPLVADSAKEIGRDLGMLS